MNDNVKFFSIISLVIFALSFLIGLINSAGFFPALLKALIFGLVVMGLLFGFSLLVRTTMSDLLAESDEESLETSGNSEESGSRVDIVVGEEPAGALGGINIEMEAPDDGKTVARNDDEGINFDNLEVGEFPDLDSFSGAFDSARESRKAVPPGAAAMSGDQNPEVMAKAVRTFMKKDEEG